MSFLAKDYLAKPSIESENPNIRGLSLSNISYSLCNPNARLKKKQDCLIFGFNLCYNMCLALRFC